MSPYLRRVKTASGATAVQVVAEENGVRRIVEHLGSARDEAELAALMHLGRQRLLAGQQVLDLGPALDGGGKAPGDGGAVRAPEITSRRSGRLIEVIKTACTRLGLGEATGGDRAFEQMVAARLIEPTSKADTPGVLSEIGWPGPARRSTLQACLARAQARGCRESLSRALFDHVTATRGLALCLYDVTTLCFEAEREDDLRKVGYSKERRVDPQVIVGLLVDRAGFPLQIGCWEGDKAETTTIIPVVEAFQAAHGIEELARRRRRRHVSGQPQGPGRGPTAVHRRRPSGPRPRRPGGPLPLGGRRLHRRAAHRHHHPQERLRSERDKSLKAEPVWDPGTHPGSWRAVWSYSKRRAARDNQTLTAQANHARAIRRRREAAQTHPFRHRPRR